MQKGVAVQMCIETDCNVAAFGELPNGSRAADSVIFRKRRLQHT